MNLSTVKLGQVRQNPIQRTVRSRQARLVLGWVTVFGWANQLSTSSRYPGQLSLLPSAVQETSTSQNAVKLCCLAVKAGMAHSTCG